MIPINRAFIFALAGALNFDLHAATSIDEAVQSALQKNEVVGQSRELVKQAEEQLSQAQSAPLPTLFLNGSHTIQPQPADPIARAFFPEKQTTTNFTLNQPLFRGAREFAGLRQRKNLLAAQKEQQIFALAQLYESVATFYLDVISLEQDLKNLNDQREIYGARIKDLQSRTRSGEARSTETLTAQASEAALEAETQVVQAKLKIARENFSLQTGLSSQSELRDESLEKLPEVGSLSNYLDKVELRADVKSALQKVKATEEEVKIAKGTYWPTLDFVGNYYLQRPDGILQDINWDVQFKLAFPIFEGGLRLSQTREASSRQSQAELELSRVRRTAITEIKNLHEGLKMKALQLAALKRSTELSQKNYQVMQRDFRRGLIRNSEVQLALTEFGVSRRAFDQAKFQIKLDKIRLEIAAAHFPSVLQGKP